MKLLKKLVPLTVLATTASIVTPMVTSCSNSSKWDINWNKKDGRYVPQVDIHETPESGTMKDDDAKEAYLDAIKDDHKVFAQDLAVWHLLSSPYMPGEFFIDVLQIKVNDVVKYPDLADTYAISYKLHIEGKLTADDPNVLHETFDVNFDSVPYSIVEATVRTDKYCSLGIAGIVDADNNISFDTLKAAYDWSIDVTYSNLTSTISRTIDSDTLKTPDDLQRFVIVMLGAMGVSPYISEGGDILYAYVPTYYMSKVKLSAE